MTVETVVHHVATELVQPPATPEFAKLYAARLHQLADIIDRIADRDLELEQREADAKRAAINARLSQHRRR